VRGEPDAAVRWQHAVECVSALQQQPRLRPEVGAVQPHCNAPILAVNAIVRVVKRESVFVTTIRHINISSFSGHSRARSRAEPKVEARSER
jgi:hypothetical protein